MDGRSPIWASSVVRPMKGVVEVERLEIGRLVIGDGLAAVHRAHILQKQLAVLL